MRLHTPIAAGLAASLLAHGNPMPPGLVHEDGWLASTNATDKVVLFERTGAAPLEGRAYVLRAEMETLEGGGSIVLSLGGSPRNNPAVSAVQLGFAGGALGMAGPGEFLGDFAALASGRLQLDARIWVARGVAKMEMTRVAGGQTRHETRTFSMPEFEDGFEFVEAHLAGAARIKNSIELYSFKNPSIFLIK
jgi:hypothetical protein